MSKTARTPYRRKKDENKNERTCYSNFVPKMHRFFYIFDV